MLARHTLSHTLSKSTFAAVFAACPRRRLRSFAATVFSAVIFSAPADFMQLCTGNLDMRTRCREKANSMVRRASSTSGWRRAHRWRYTYEQVSAMRCIACVALSVGKAARGRWRGTDRERSKAPIDRRRGYPPQPGRDMVLCPAVLAAATALKTPLSLCCRSTCRCSPAVT